MTTSRRLRPETPGSILPRQKAGPESRPPLSVSSTLLLFLRPATDTTPQSGHAKSPKSSAAPSSSGRTMRSRACSPLFCPTAPPSQPPSHPRLHSLKHNRSRNLTLNLRLRKSADRRQMTHHQNASSHGRKTPLRNRPRSAQDPHPPRPRHRPRPSSTLKRHSPT